MPAVLNTFKITGLDAVLEITGSRDEALAAGGGPAERAEYAGAPADRLLTKSSAAASRAVEKPRGAHMAAGSRLCPGTWMLEWQWRSPRACPRSGPGGSVERRRHERELVLLGFQRDPASRDRVLRALLPLAQGIADDTAGARSRWTTWSRSRRWAS